MKHKTNKLRDNDYLCALDMSHATDEQQRAWLTLIIDNELSRGDEKDEQLICECADHLELLSPDTAMSAEECMAHLQVLLKNTGNKRSVTKKARILPLPELHSHRKFAIRIAALASALIMIVTLSPQAYALVVSQRDNRQYEEVILPEVTEMEENYLTALSPEATYAKPYQATYETLADFFDRHSQLSFYYPHQLPRSQAIRSIRITYLSEENWLVIFTFHDPSIRHYTVQRLSQMSDPPSPSEDAMILTVDGREYVTTKEKGLYKTVCTDGDIRYTLTTEHDDMTREILSLTKSRAYRYSTMEALLSDWEHLQEFAWQEQLPAGFSIGSVTLNYETQTAWQIVAQLKYSDGMRSSANHAITISPIVDTTERDLGNSSPQLSNEKTDIYIRYSGKRESDSLCQAECIMGDIKYNTKIFGYDLFMIFLNDFFGPF